MANVHPRTPSGPCYVCKKKIRINTFWSHPEFGDRHISCPHKEPEPAEKTRQLWDVWRQGQVWMVQGPAARVHFFSRKTAMAVAQRAKELAAIEKRTAATCAANQREGYILPEDEGEEPTEAEIDESNQGGAR